MEIEKSKKDYGIVDHLLTTNEFKRPIVLQNATAVEITFNGSWYKSSLS